MSTNSFLLDTAYPICSERTRAERTKWNKKRLNAACGREKPRRWCGNDDEIAILSLPNSRGAFAVTRPLSTSIVVNLSDIGRDTVLNGAAMGGDRTLNGTIAHESAHLLIYRRYGIFAAVSYPRWAIEGYCDHVAGESSLSAAEAETLRRAGQTPSALIYYDARVRVDRALAGGMSVDALMRGN
ncbi:hypothetical protein OF829_17835 [Sphingomonas sp. LB-2]|uniref:hypothetical protein n=1 Tax=Sphingomonas caeni TaxID=2984949 RepID=UPI00222FAEBD|nr:hypothetical protein [Sphingomonas caeni]MCW3849104.1 hypothetical protein [Sphingomonas caeni]